MGQHLEEGVTYIYQITQTQVVQVPVISAARISFPPDSRAHSSQELEILMWRTTKSLESINDSRHISETNRLNFTMIWTIFLVITFFKRWTSIFVFYIKKHYFLLSTTKAKANRLNYWNSHLIFRCKSTLTKVETITSNSILFPNFNDY